LFDVTDADAVKRAAPTLSGTLQSACLGSGPLVQPPLLPRERALAKLRAGVPLLHAEPLVVDSERARAMLQRSTHAVERQAPGGGAKLVSEATKDGRLDPEHMLLEAMAGHFDHLDELADAVAAPRRALRSILEPLANAALQQLQLRLAPLLSTPGEWTRTYCPLCGGRAELAGDGAPLRGRAVCTRCGAAWQPDARQPSLGDDNPAEFRLELGEPHVDEALDDLLEAD
jgi:hypothetical protein